MRTTIFASAAKHGQQFSFQRMAGAGNRYFSGNGWGWVVCRGILRRHRSSRLMERVRRRVRDRKVLRLVLAFLKADIMIEGNRRHPVTGTPQGGILAP